jgi:hypothetical protein
MVAVATTLPCGYSGVACSFFTSGETGISGTFNAASEINWVDFANSTSGLTVLTAVSTTFLNAAVNSLDFKYSGGTAGNLGTAVVAMKNLMNSTHYLEVESLNGSVFEFIGDGWTSIATSKNQLFRWDDDTSGHSVVVRSTGLAANVTAVVGSIDTEGGIFRIKRR